jgi:hypothetical protein
MPFHKIRYGNFKEMLSYGLVTVRKIYSRLPTFKPSTKKLILLRLKELFKTLFHTVNYFRTFYIMATLIILSFLCLYLIKWPDKIYDPAAWKGDSEDVRNAALVFGGTVVAILGLFLTGIRTHALDIQARVTEQGHITDRFTKSIEQLGNDKLEVRLGAIYALERIAYDSSRDHWPIMETLTAYIRENSPWPPKESDPEHTLQAEIRRILQLKHPLISRERKSISEHPRLL